MNQVAFPNCDLQCCNKNWYHGHSKFPIKALKALYSVDVLLKINFCIFHRWMEFFMLVLIGVDWFR